MIEIMHLEMNESKTKRINESAKKKCEYTLIINFNNYLLKLIGNVMSFSLEIDEVLSQLGKQKHFQKNCAEEIDFRKDVSHL